MMNKYLILVLAGLLAMGCKESGLQQDPNTLPVGEPIEMTLGFSLERSQAFSRAQPTATQWSGDGFDAQITAAPIDEPQSKAVEEDRVANVWVLQFDGDATSSKLRYKIYVKDYVAGSKVILLKAVANNRVAIIANSFDETLGDSFTVGTTTWADVKAASKTIATQSDLLPTDAGSDYVPMSGTVVGTLAVRGTLAIPLTRTVVKVVVKLQSGADLKATELDVQLCNVPSASSFFPDMGTGLWPAWGSSPAVVDYPEEQLTGITTTAFVERTFWIPINRRGAVAGTERLTRATNAPPGATFVQAIFKDFTYQIHLGADFATDYNLQANTTYTYELTLLTDPLGTDSRVDLRPTNPPTADQIVEIDGLMWTKGNLVAKNGNECKVGAPTDYGVYFHFGSLVGWKGGSNGDGTGTGSPARAVQVKPARYSGSTSWPAGYYTGGTTDTKGYDLPDTDAPATGIGDPCRYYLGGTWRTPTADEWLALLGASGVNTNKQVPLKLTNYDLSFPASGNRDSSNGVFFYVGSIGYCWSSSVSNATNGYILYFSSSVSPQSGSRRSGGMPVRCVAEVPPPPTTNPPTEDQIVEIDGLKWTKGNLVAKNGNECKVGAATDYGLYFHFGSLVGWSGGSGDGTGSGDPALSVQAKPSNYSGSTSWPAGYYNRGVGVETSDYSMPLTDDGSTGIGDPCRYYLGASWRIPTTGEWMTLMGDAYGGNTDKKIPLKVNGFDLAFPGPGIRYDATKLSSADIYGSYWSSSLFESGNAKSLCFYSGAIMLQGSTSPHCGASVRCVSGELPPPLR